jgi:hypothetical protein
MKKARIRKPLPVLSFPSNCSKRAIGFEPTTSSLGSWHSTTELRPQSKARKSYPSSPSRGKRLRPAQCRCHNTAMPLDVQPLSMRRQIIRILVMLAMLAGSLGLAQALIMRRVPAARWRGEFPPPPEVDRMPVNESAPAVLQGAMVEAAATWPQGERRFLAFFWEDEHDVDPRQYIQIIISQVLTITPARAVRLQPEVLAGYPALEAETYAGRGENAAFAIIRLATAEDHIVAFCFSGQGVMTDADRKFFDDYCSRQIKVRREHATRG